ncbi:MAG: hypothetical protein CND89_06020 [Marine Group II euryarchaeote MED-G38]|nr:MAG: hypothetical protein CND89_06020 [Marine Group II euryarchaeote MED-G38]
MSEDEGAFNTKNIAVACVIIGLLLPLLNLTIISGIVSDGVADGVGEILADDRDELSDWEDPDWLVSSSERAYFANSITNLENLEDGTDTLPTLEKMGPFVYNVTTTRDIIDFDEENGTITYSEYDIFDWCSTCTWMDEDGNEHASLDGNTEISQINILWNTQKIAGVGTGIEYGEIFAKAGFANSMIQNDLINRAPSIWASEGIASMISSAGSSEAVLDNSYTSWNTSYSLGTMEPNFSSSAEMIMNGARDYSNVLGTNPDGSPSGHLCIALTCDVGPMLVSGMGEPSDTVTSVRSVLYGYSDVSEPEKTHIDWAVYSLAGSMFLNMGGGTEDLRNSSDLNARLVEVCGSGCDFSTQDPAVLDYTLFGIDDNGLAAGLIAEEDFGGIPLHGVALFLLGAQSSPYNTMEAYGMGLTQVLALADYAGGWSGLLGVPSDFEMILVGGTETMNSDSWWQHSFGGEEPINGGYLSIGLNRGSYEGLVDIGVEKASEILYGLDYGLTGSFSTAFVYGELSGFSLPTAPNGFGQVEWTDAYVAGLYGISEDDAAALKSWILDFMFPQVVPALLSFQYGASAYTTQPMNNWLYGWSDSVLEGLYSPEESWVTLETNATYYGSSAMDQDGDGLPDYLEIECGSNPSSSMSIQEDWSDPNCDPQLDGLSTGDFTVYMMSTGTGNNNADNMEHGIQRGFINSDGDGLCDFKLDADGAATYDVPCEVGEIYGMTEHLPWRAPHKEASTLGLLTENVGNSNTVWAGTIGGIADAKESFNVNLAGYSIAPTVVGSEADYKEIPMVDHSITLDPAENQIQGKLIGSGTYVDAIPGALPVYFGSNVDIKVEPVTNVAMYAKGISTFYFDYRGPGSIDPDFGAETTKAVFEIHTFSEISDDDARIFKGKVLDHMGPFFWTDFGGSGDTELEPVRVVSYISAAMYLGGLVLMAIGASNLRKLNGDLE